MFQSCYGQETGLTSNETIEIVDNFQSEVVDVKPDLTALLFTSPNPGSWACDTCDRSFQSYASLAEHVGEDECNPLWRNKTKVQSPIQLTKYMNTTTSITVSGSGSEPRDFVPGNSLYTFCTAMNFQNPMPMNLEQEESSFGTHLFNPLAK